MAWKIKDEWIDLGAAKHTVIFVNSDTGAEHHLINNFGLAMCPTCGHAQAGDSAEFEKVKADELEALQTHHRMMLDYQAKNPRIELRNGPKK